jgi:RimJ/RimL family protein N-acetyltransferase
MSNADIQLKFRPMDMPGARAVCAWRYEPPYQIYNLDAPRDQVPRILAFLVDPANAYWCIDGLSGLEAFCCFGLDAQVPGGHYAAPALDIGLGVRPDLTGRGRGLSYAQAVIAFAHQRFARTALRVTIAAFNQRAIRVWEKAGFHRVHTFADAREGRPFVILVYPRETLETTVATSV